MSDERDESEQEQKRRLRLIAAPRDGEVISRKPAPRPRDDDEFDDDGPSRADIERFNNVTMRCPHCGKEVFDDVAICYHCNMAITKPIKGVPMWVIITVIAVLLGFLVAAVPWHAMLP
jgi:hypothetical protein